MELALTYKRHNQLSSLAGIATCSLLAEIIQAEIANFADNFVQDLSHINQAATYSGGLLVDKVEHIKDNRYRCSYSYDWLIAWNCAGLQESGRVVEKVHFVLEIDKISFKFLKFD